MRDIQDRIRKEILLPLLCLFSLHGFIYAIPPLCADDLEVCGYRELPLVMEQVPKDGAWVSNNDHAMGAWNQYMRLYSSKDTDGSWGKNRVSEIGGFPSDDSLVDMWEFHWGDDLALTYIHMPLECGKIWESDIVFNPAYSWTGDPNDAEDHAERVIYYDAVLMHELAHTWGMETRHEDPRGILPTVTHGYVSRSVQDQRLIHVPEAYLVRRRYADQTPILTLKNMAIVSKYADGSWKNATTDRTHYFAGDPLSISGMTIENTGTQDLENVHLLFYLSTDRSFIPSDTKIGDFKFDRFPAEAYGVYDFDMAIPESLIPGSYYVGASITTQGYSSDDIHTDDTTHVWGKINVSQRTITVTSPRPGETWYVGEAMSIAWNSFEAGSTVKIEVVRDDDRLGWKTIAESTENTGLFNWTVSSPSSSLCHIKITSVSYPFVIGISQSFRINDPEIRVTSPVGGERWYQGSTVLIQWAYRGNPGSDVRIELLGGGSVRSAITKRTYIGSDRIGLYEWSIPMRQKPGETYKIRVSSTSHPAYRNVSNETFTIAQPTMTIQSPRAMETWQAGTTQTIRWNFEGDPGPDVTITLYRGKLPDSVISVNASMGSQGTGSYDWAIPTAQPARDDYNIRVTCNLQPIKSDIMEGSFRIAGPLKLTSPIGGESWEAGTRQTITWSFMGNPTGGMKIELYRGDGLDRTIVTSSSIQGAGSPGDGSYNWEIPLDQAAGSDYRIKVSITNDSSYVDSSERPFTITRF